jgi:hypothetical protein
MRELLVSYVCAEAPRLRSPNFSYRYASELLTSPSAVLRRWPPTRALLTLRNLSLLLEPRSLYVPRGPVRIHCQHHIPPTKRLRYSITFRTLRGLGD